MVSWLPLLALFAAEPPFPPPATIASGATLQPVYTGKLMYDGPVWNERDGKLYFTGWGPEALKLLRLDAPNEVSVVLEESGGLLGLAPGPDGWILAANAAENKIERLKLGPNGIEKRETVVANPAWQPPTDLVAAPTGGFYFSAPKLRQRGETAVFHVALNGDVTRVIPAMPFPNGLGVSADGRWLVVSDSTHRLWRRFPIRPDGTLASGIVFFRHAGVADHVPDGVAVDEQSNFYLTGLGGVWVLSAARQPLGFIPIPEFCSNVAFGGADGKTLFITCRGQIYSLKMKVRGVHSPHVAPPTTQPTTSSTPEQSADAADD